MKNNQAEIRRDPIRSKIPERPVGERKSAEILLLRREDREDPRGALLKMNDIASKKKLKTGEE
jgi:hypothetical protein